MRKTIKIAAIAGTTTTLALIIFFSLFFAINSLQKTAKNAFDKKHYQKTRNILEELQTENPNNPLLSFNLGVANHKENRFTQAEKHFLRAATLAEKHPDQQFLEPKAYANAGNSKFADATKDLKENLKSKEKVAKAIQELQTAANHCYAALKKEPKNQRVKNNLKAIEDLIEQLKKYLEQIENEPEKAENSRKDIENKLDQNQQDQSQKQDSKKSDSKDSQNQHNPNQQSQQQNSPDQQDQQGENQDQSQQESGQTQENNQQKDQGDKKDSDSKNNDKAGNSQKSSPGGSGNENRARQDMKTQDLSMSNTGDQMDDSQNGEKTEEEKEGTGNNDENKPGEQENSAGATQKEPEKDSEEFSELMSKNQDAKKDGQANEKPEQDSGQANSQAPSMASNGTDDSQTSSQNMVNVQELMEERGSKLLLDQLDNNEAQLQKRRILALSKGTAPVQNYGQKSW